MSHSKQIAAKFQPLTPNQKSLVYVVDDDEAIRDSLSLLLNANGFRVSCHESAEQFLQALNSNDKTPLSCALLDLNLHGMSGVELQDTLLKMKFNIPIAFITGQGDIAKAVQAIKNGAVDFIEKPIKEDRLCDLIRAMLTKAQLEREQYLELQKISQKYKTLTVREVEVLRLIVAGRINKQIGADLGISIKTVEAHRANLMKKLQVSRPTKLLHIALKYQDAKAQGLI